MLERHPRWQARVNALQAIDGIGPVTALTWALEIATPERFRSAKAATSDCGLTSALRESAGQQKRGPLSKQRNRHLQSALIEAGQIAPLVNEKLREVHAKPNRRAGTPIGRRWQWRASQVGISIFLAGEAEVGSGGDQPAKEYPARLIRVKGSTELNSVHNGPPL